MDFNDDQIERYSRHIILKEVGLEGQIKISQAKVLVIGAGGLGSPVLLYLAAAGVGTIGIADNDVLDLSNLQRQVIHSTPDLNRPKVESARDRINALNPDVQVEAFNGLITADNIRETIKKYDFVIDGTDNFASKFLINDACVLEGKPFSHGGILRFHGQIITVIPHKSACYRCVFVEPPPPDSVPTCSQAGILGVIAGVMGTLQANECLKYILNQGDLLTDRLLIFDALNTSFDKVKLKKNPKCPVCGENPSITDLTDDEQAVCDI